MTISMTGVHMIGVPSPEVQKWSNSVEDNGSNFKLFRFSNSGNFFEEELLNQIFVAFAAVQIYIIGN